MQVLETIVGIAVINAAVSKAGPLEDEIFKLDIRYKQDCYSQVQHSLYKQAGLHLLAHTRCKHVAVQLSSASTWMVPQKYLTPVIPAWVLQEAFQQARWVAVLGLAGLPGCTCCGRRLCLLGLCCGL